MWRVGAKLEGGQVCDSSEPILNKARYKRLCCQEHYGDEMRRFSTIDAFLYFGDVFVRGPKGLCKSCEKLLLVGGWALGTTPFSYIHNIMPSGTHLHIVPESPVPHGSTQILGRRGAHGNWLAMENPMEPRICEGLPRTPLSDSPMRKRNVAAGGLSDEQRQVGRGKKSVRGLLKKIRSACQIQNGRYMNSIKEHEFHVCELHLQMVRCESMVSTITTTGANWKCLIQHKNYWESGGSVRAFGRGSHTSQY